MMEMSICREVLVVCFLMTSFVGIAASYKHIIFMHGVFAGPSEFKDLHDYITKVHPGTGFTVINAYNDDESVSPLWKQVETIRPQMAAAMAQHKDGVHLMCFSQGGLVCRGVLETLPTHNVDTFIALSTPQGGQFGDTSYFQKFFPHVLKDELYKLFYSRLGQWISIANYWNDPHHQNLYSKYSAFLAVINNQTSNPKSQAYKDNFLRLKNVVLIGGPDDGVITPWQSSQFAAYNSEEQVVEMKQQEWYERDWFGLQTLDKRGGLHMCTVPGVEHIKWHRNLTVFQQCIEKWLT